MPKLPQQVLNSVFYLYKDRESAERGGPFGGTGFFIGIPVPDRPNLWFSYAITNWHVAVRDGCSFLRVNMKSGGTEVLEFEPHDWEFEAGQDDLAIADVTLRADIHDISVLADGFFLKKDEIKSLEIGPGEDVFMVGRFVDHDGAKENVPAVRFGNISVMPQPVGQPTGSILPSFILDIHSRTGFSGSPVFVYRTLGSDLTGAPLRISPDNFILRLLGIHWGQFPEKWEIRSTPKTADLVSHNAPLLSNEKYVHGWSGMCLAIPAWRILEFLDMPRFREGRRRELLRLMAKADDTGPVAEGTADLAEIADD